MLASECGGKGEGRVNWLLNFTYLACVSDFTTLSTSFDLAVEFSSHFSRSVVQLHGFVQSDPSSGSYAMQCSTFGSTSCLVWQTNVGKSLTKTETMADQNNY